MKCPPIDFLSVHDSHRITSTVTCREGKPEADEQSEREVKVSETREEMEFRDIQKSYKLLNTLLFLLHGV